MLQLQPDRPLSKLLVELIGALDQVTSALGIPYFIIGATARDILLKHVYALETSRATRDIDFAVAVSSWQQFDMLKAQLINTGKFAETVNAHRLSFGEGPGAYPLDLVPFDGVERHGVIAWPPRGEFVMNATGYADALASTLSVVIDPGLETKIVSLPAMVALKILAWNDRPERDKDASDVLLLLKNYHEAGQSDRLYDDGHDLLKQWNYDVEVAGSALLGRDACRDIQRVTMAQVLNVLEDDKRLNRFTAQMLRQHYGNKQQATLILDAFVQTIKKYTA